MTTTICFPAITDDVEQTLPVAANSVGLIRIQESEAWRAWDDRSAREALLVRELASDTGEW